MAHYQSDPPYTYQRQQQYQDSPPVELYTVHPTHSEKYMDSATSSAHHFSIHASDEMPLKQHSHLVVEQEVDTILATDQRGKWSPGVSKLFPWLAVGALFGALACTAMSVFVLLRSDGMNLGAWTPFTPSICLAALSVLANALIGYALVEALTIIFWRRMAQGRAMQELSRNWESGHSLWGAITMGFRSGGRVTALARITTVLALARGPVFQRASAVLPNHQISTEGSLDIKLAQTLPLGYGALQQSDRASQTHSGSKSASLTANFTEILSDYSNNADLVLDHSGCGDSCEITLKGFGFRSDCQTGETSTSYPMTSGHTETMFSINSSLYNMYPERKTAGYYYDYAGLQLSTNRFVGHKGQGVPCKNSGNDCQNATTVTYLTTHVCNLTFGIVQYKLDLDGNKVKMQPSSEDVFIQPIDMYTTRSGALGNTGGTIIGGFEYVTDLLFGASAVYMFSGTVNGYRLTGTLANQMLDTKNSSTYQWDDPMDIMLSGLRNIAIRAALKAGKEETNNTVTLAAQTVPYVGRETYSIYRTDYPSMIAAAALSLLSIGSVCAVLYGWWELGREVSMHPFEIGKAFGSPFLAGAGSNVPFEKYADEIRERVVRYGVVKEHSSDGGVRASQLMERLMVDGYDGVDVPRNKVHYH